MRRNPPVAGYLIDHWRGRHSLARSFWINGVLPLAGVTAATACLEWIAPSDRTDVFFLRRLIALALILMAGAWAAPGVWRSAGAARRATGRKPWPSVAQGLVLGAGIATIVGLVPIIRDYLAIIRAIHGPPYGEYRIERRGENEIMLIGAISDGSVAAAIEGLSPARPVLRLNSFGGLIQPAVRLARFVRERAIMVVAAGECRSACLFVLAASPNAALMPGSRVTFHHVQPIADYESAAMRAGYASYVEEVAGYYREFGVPDWAIDRMEREGTWTPSIHELIGLGLIDAIFDPASQSFVPARAYCAENSKACSE